MLLWGVTYGQGTDLYALSTILNGALYFALPLMAILGTHEMGHYLLARRHNVAASLPFFIPLPTSFLGTLGAFISMREPIPNKKALLDIGIAGPLAGLAVAFPVTFLGLYLNSVNPVPTGTNIGGFFGINFPLIYYFFFSLIPLPQGIALHPTVVAGWVGFFVTALNLLPAGQLDGGHIARALLGKNSRYLSYGAFFALLAMGFIFFPSWLLLAFLVLLLGLRHPPPLNDLTEIRAGRKSLGLAVLIILILSFVPQPLVQIGVEVKVEFRSWQDPTLLIQEDNVTLDLENRTAVYAFYVNNTGNVLEEIRLSIEAPNLPEWNISFISVAGREIGADSATINLSATESSSAIVLIQAHPRGRCQARSSPSKLSPQLSTTKARGRNSTSTSTPSSSRTPRSISRGTCGLEGRAIQAVESVSCPGQEAPRRVDKLPRVRPASKPHRKP